MAALAPALHRLEQLAKKHGHIKIDSVHAARLFRDYHDIRLRHHRRQTQLHHRLSHYHQQLRLTESGLRQAILDAIHLAKHDPAALCYVDLTIFDTLHRLLNDVELVALDADVLPSPPLTRPLPVLTPGEYPEQSQSSSDSET